MNDSSATAIRGPDAAHASKGRSGACLYCSLLPLHEDYHRVRDLQGAPRFCEEERGALSFREQLGVRDSPEWWSQP